NFILFITVANLYGASQHTDWFFFVYSIAYFFIGISYSATESAMVPVWHILPEKEHAKLFHSTFLLAGSGLLLMIIGLELSGLYLAPLRGIALPDSMDTAFKICFILALQPSLAFLSSFFSSYRQFRQQYILPTLHLTLRTIGVLTVLLLIPHRTITGLAVAYLVGESIRLLCLRHRIKIKKTDTLSSRIYSLKSLYGHVAWMIIALIGTVINPVIDLAMIGKFHDGSLTLVDYANRLKGMPVLAFGGLAVYYLGEWSHQYYQQEGMISWPHIRNTSLKIITFCIPIVLLLIFTESIWIPMLFFSKQFDPDKLQKLQLLLYWYFPGVPFLASALILSRIILVIQKANLLALTTLSGAGLNVILNLLLIKKMGLPGVALSTTLVDIFVCLIYFLIAQHFLSKHSAQDNITKKRRISSA
ncbi:MAG: hypothetical protein D3923_11550, partial [Candidatus Electrothrix sp. AR3]|nr:hypothetical protein [Candidatus Electrothrix sp. AR3]